MDGPMIVTILVAFFSLLTCAYLGLRLKSGQYSQDVLNKLTQDIQTA